MHTVRPLTAAKTVDGLWGVREYTRTEDGRVQLGMWVSDKGGRTTSSSFHALLFGTSIEAASFVLGYDLMRRETLRFLGKEE